MCKIDHDAQHIISALTNSRNMRFFHSSNNNAPWFFFFSQIIKIAFVWCCCCFFLGLDDALDAMLGLQSQSSYSALWNTITLGIYWIGHKGYAIVLVVYKKLNTCAHQHTVLSTIYTGAFHLIGAIFTAKYYFFPLSVLSSPPTTTTIKQCWIVVLPSHTMIVAKRAGLQTVKRRQPESQSSVGESEKTTVNRKYCVRGNVLNENKWFAQHVVHGTEYQ